MPIPTQTGASFPVKSILTQICASFPLTALGAGKDLFDRFVDELLKGGFCAAESLSR